MRLAGRILKGLGLCSVRRSRDRCFVLGGQGRAVGKRSNTLNGVIKRAPKFAIFGGARTTVGLSLLARFLGRSLLRRCLELFLQLPPLPARGVRIRRFRNRSGKPRQPHLVPGWGTPPACSRDHALNGIPHDLGHFALPGGFEDSQIRAQFFRRFRSSSHAVTIG